MKKIFKEYKKSMTENPIILEKLKSLLTYDPLTGQLFSKDRITKDNPKGLIVLSPTSRVKMFAALGKSWTVGRLSWFLGNGYFPPENTLVSFKNKDTTDFRLENLLLTNRSLLKLNSNNKPKRYKKGVFHNPRRKSLNYGAIVRIKKKPIYLGYFESEQLAHEIYIKAIEEYTLKGTVTVLNSDNTFTTHFKQT